MPSPNVFREGFSFFKVMRISIVGISSVGILRILNNFFSWFSVFLTNLSHDAKDSSKAKNKADYDHCDLSFLFENDLFLEVPLLMKMSNTEDVDHRVQLISRDR